MQHHRGGGEPPYGAPMPSMAAFSLPPPPPPHAATVPAPTASDVLLPPTQPQMAPVTAPGEFTPAAGSGSAAAVNFHEDDMMVLDVSGGAGGSGNRWPREETLALIRIRSEMDAAFRNAALKAPVWEELSRRLAELGYHRSGKKCKEKFENVDKYYKRTKEGRAGRQDGKSYRFFSQLEALHAAAPSQQQQKAVTVQDPRPLAIARMAPGAGGLGGQAGGGASLPDLSFLSMSSESESESDQEFDDDDDEEEEEVAGGRDGLGGFRSGGDDVEGEGSRSRMMVLFEGMMRRVTEKQDAMQRAFLETLDRWETERTQREEAWRRKEVARMNRERELLSQERAAAASRDAALIEFLNSISGDQPVRLSPSTIAAMRATFPGPHHDAAAAAGLHLIPVPPKPKPEEGCAGGEGSGLTPSSRWPKEEVQALIEMRVEKEEQYSDMGPKGPLWEEIAAGMQRIGYNRSAKRCKEKWENINKYFKKVKESNKRRPEDSKTCPYFHQLDAIYRKKHFAGRGSGVATASGTSLAIVTVPGQESPSQRELEGKSRNDGMPQHGDNAVTADKKAEVTGTEPNVTPEETDSDDMEGNYTEGDDDDKMQYKIEFQKPNAIGGGSNTPSPATTAAATSSTRTPTSNTSFLAVQ